VAGFQSALATPVPHAAVTLRREHPGIELHLTEAHPRVSLDLLRTGQVDAAVIVRYDDTTQDDIPSPICSTTRPPAAVEPTDRCSC
jgi:DNA-binding transcriptional LysR family regulator